ncbi:MAG TPA: hypothetical protein VF677_15430 [Flavobacterium sp.]|jgi:glycosylphosphatidylinositol transamidase (GPIT) subunit GPI8
MKKITFVFCLLLSLSLFAQNKVESFTEIGEKYATKSKDTNSQYKEYAKESSNKIHYNTGFGESKYDKEINWDTDIDPNNVKESIEKFRDKKRREEILFYAKIVLSIIVILLVAFFISKAIKKR